MGDTTHIAWADKTFNPWIGCTQCGPGCKFCYAESRDKRFAGGAHWGVGAARQRTSRANWAKPLEWNREAQRTGYRPRVMCGSLCDIFDKEVDPAWRADLATLWRATPALRWMVITKRIGLAPRMLPASWPDGFENVGLIATVVTQRELRRDARKLFAVPAAWWGLSMEPQLERIVLPASLPPINRFWVITGGESHQRGMHASPVDVRPYDLGWGHDLVRQGALGGFAVFVKQLGANPVAGGVPYCCARDPVAGADMADWPGGLQVQQFPQPLE